MGKRTLDLAERGVKLASTSPWLQTFMSMARPSFLSLPLLRAAVLAVAGIGLAGCGFTPMYAAPDTPQATAMTATMAAIQIRPIADHDGVKLRQILREGLQPDGPAQRSLYDLDVQMRSVTQDLGVRLDATASRANLIYTARFALLQNGKHVFSDQVQTIVSYDIADDQYATVAATNDAGDRAIKQIGEEIKMRLGIYLRAHKNEIAASP